MRKGIILLVEDNPDDVDLTLIGFKRNGIVNQVIVARDGQEALDYLGGVDSNGNPNELPVVMILDLNLPRISGLDVLRRVRENERTKLIPTVILTTSDEQSDLIASYRLGANAYVRKPVDFNQFHEAARELALFWLLLNVPPNG